MPINVLIIEDSPVAANLLRFIISQDPAFDVVGMASTAEESFVMIERLRPNVLTLDLQLPGIDGVAAAKHIVERYQLPILVVTGTLAVQDVAGEFRAIDAGALAVVRKPPGPGDPTFHEQCEKIHRLLKEIASVRVGYREYQVVRYTVITKLATERLAQLVDEPAPTFGIIGENQRIRGVLD